MWGEIPGLGIQELCAANLAGKFPSMDLHYQHHFGQLPSLECSWKLDLLFRMFICYSECLDAEPGCYLGIEELGMNLLVSFPQELALFSQFKHCVCRRRRNSLKRDLFFFFLSVPSPFLTTNSSWPHRSLQGISNLLILPPALPGIPSLQAPAPALSSGPRCVCHKTLIIRFFISLPLCRWREGGAGSHCLFLGELEV